MSVKFSSKSLVPVEDKYTTFAKLNRNRSNEEFWNEVCAPIISASMKHLQHTKKAPIDPNRKTLPHLKSGIIELFPEMKDDTDAILAVGKKIGLHWGNRKKNGKISHELFAPYYRVFPVLFKTRKQETKLDLEKAAEPIVTPMVETAHTISNKEFFTLMMTSSKTNHSEEITREQYLHIINYLSRS